MKTIYPKDLYNKMLYTPIPRYIRQYIVYYTMIFVRPAHPYIIPPLGINITHKMCTHLNGDEDGYIKFELCPFHWKA